MRLYDYVIQCDEDEKWRWDYCKENNYNPQEYLIEGYCPTCFNCFKNTEFEKPFSPYKGDKTDCKYNYNNNEKKCKECWNREIDSEYDIYLKLKEKYEK